MFTVAVGLVISRMVPSYRVMQDRIDGINGVLREQIAGIRVVRAFVREKNEVERFDGVAFTESGVLPLLVEAGFLAGPRRAVLRP